MQPNPGFLLSTETLWSQVRGERVVKEFMQRKETFVQIFLNKKCAAQ